MSGRERRFDLGVDPLAAAGPAWDDGEPRSGQSGHGRADVAVFKSHVKN